MKYRKLKISKKKVRKSVFLRISKKEFSFSQFVPKFFLQYYYIFIRTANT